MKPQQSVRTQLVAVAIATLAMLLAEASPSKHVVVFHNTIPSNLYVNAAHGPVHIKDDPSGRTEIINLLLYPTDKRSRAPKTARAVINSGGVSGLVTLRQDDPPVGPTFIVASLKGLKPGTHGFKIFEFGDIKDSCTRVGDIYNPYQLDSSTALYRRKPGDLGIIMADRNGKAEPAMSDSFVSLVGPRSVIGRSIVIIEDNDHSGSAKAKVGCGVIGFAK